MRVTVLHISDLHRDPGNPLTNDALLNSIARDNEQLRAVDERAGSPDIVIASGDLVHGVPATGSVVELTTQYEEACAFLTEISNRFTDGDRDRVIVVPGNHDVSYPHVYESLRQVPADQLEDDARRRTAVERLFSASSNLRWDWNNLRLLEISDKPKYAARFECFGAFYGRFYETRRVFSNEPEQQYELFDYPQYQLCVTAFNSCHHNDPLSRRAWIHPDCIARARTDLGRPEFRNRVVVATWHHSAHGAPHETDYLHPDTLQLLMQNGFSIGFHGHRHRTSVIDEVFQFGQNLKMTVIGAGTLCGGERSLPPGHRRSYNIVTLDFEAMQGRLYQRQMQNSDFTAPIWGDGHDLPAGQNVAEFMIQAPHHQNGAGPSLVATQGEAQRAIEARDYRKAISLLERLTADGMVRRMLFECFQKLDDEEALATRFNPPRGDGETVAVIEAMWSTGRKAELAQLLTDPQVRSATHPAIVELREKYLGRLAN